MTSSTRAAKGRSLGRMLGLSYGFLVLLLVLTGASGVGAFSVALSGVDAVSKHVQPARQANESALLALTQVQSSIRGYLLTGRGSLLHDVPTDSDAARTELSRLDALVDGTAVGRAATHERRLATGWLRSYVHPALDLSNRPGGWQALRQFWDYDAAQAAFAELTVANSTVNRQLDAEIADRNHKGLNARIWALTALLSVALISVLAGAAAAILTSRTMLGPLSRLRTALERLTAGDNEARADEDVGPVEVRAVGAALNRLADESDRLRAAEMEQTRARRLAHDVGLRIRERFELQDVEQTAAAELGMAFGVDRVLLRAVEDDRLTPPRTQWQEVDLSPLDDQALLALGTPGDLDVARRLWAEVAVVACDDVVGQGCAAELMGPVLAAVPGARAALVCAYGAGRELLGTVTLVHHTPRTWSAAEISALESIAADIGRAYQHAVLYQRERTLVRELRELDRSKTDFLSTVSHELRTPLTSIAGYIEMLRDGDGGPVTAGQKRMLDVVDRNADRLQSLIEDLLTLSRIESHAFRTQLVPVDVSSLLNNAAAAVEPQASAAQLRLIVEPPPAGDQLQVLGDPGQLDRVLLNLLSNGVKFTQSDGEVRLAWTATAERVRVTVQDTGIGVPAGELARLSTRFFRASNATSNAIQGTGLGLTIVRGIVEHHGGSMSITSTEGTGTTVTVELPRLLPAPTDGDVEREQPGVAARL